MPRSARSIELLAPARDAEIAIAAIDHGADAVYLGGPDFSARHQAGNPVEQLARVADYAHRYRARVYVTLNTLLQDEELPRAEAMIREVCSAGIDALIVQDMAVLEMDLPPVELHASTQAHIDTVEKALFLHRAGFSRLVLARELSLPQIEAIARESGAEIEAFVHGALCVSYSGQCYLSQALCGRSANRGRCAQVCRLPFDVSDPEGHLLRTGTHALSLKDMNRSAYLEALIDAGVCSLKIEGRLKDLPYVKNITAYYRRTLDDILSRRPDLARASDGQVDLRFTPDPARSFNRGYTDYLLHGERTEDLSNPATPKSIGQPAGHIVSVSRDSFTTDSPLAFAPGDGFVYLRRGEVQGGFRINRAQGSRLYPSRMPSVRPGDLLYRNQDAAFDRLLAASSATRKVAVDLRLEAIPEGFRLLAEDESGLHAESTLCAAHTPADTPQKARLEQALSKLGGTEFEARHIAITFPSEYFLPLSAVSALRRQTLEALREVRLRSVTGQRQTLPHAHPPLPPGLDTDYRLNVSNRLTRQFYRQCGATRLAPAYEQQKVPGAQLAVCLHCLQYSLGLCPRQHPGKGFPYLVLRHGRFALRAEFDCAHCRMKLFALP